jgi:non-ribosomal peptide synthetase component F
LAAFAVLLRHYAKRDDIVVGTDVAGRNRVEVEPLIGFFVNQLVLRNDLAGNPDFDELLRRVRKVALEAYAHQDLPFERVAAAVRRTDGSLRHAPLFQVKLILNNTPPADLELPNLALSAFGGPIDKAELDLIVTLAEMPTGLLCGFNYSTDLFREETIVRMMEQFALVLHQVAERPGVRVSELDEMLAKIGREERAPQVREQRKASFEKFKKRGTKPLA